jgi:hypothetical protein
VTIRTSGELAQRLGRMSDEMKSGVETLAKHLGEEAKTIYKVENRIKIPRKKPVKWGGQVTVLNGGVATRVKFRPTPTGLSQLVEGGSNASGWFEGSKHSGGSRRSRETKFLRGDATGGGRRAVLNIPGIGFRRFVVHPKIGPIDHPLGRTADRLPRASTAVIQKDLVAPLAKRFTGG